MTAALSPYPYPGGTGIVSLRNSRLIWGVGSLLVSAILLAAGGGADDAKRPKEGDDDGEEPVYALTEGIRPPRVTKHVDPRYSPSARGIPEGSVWIETVVSSRGTPKKTRVVRGIDKDVDEAAVEAVKEWLFEPGRKDGKAVAVKVQIEIRFHTM